MTKDWTGNTSIYACNHRAKEEDVAENDFYATHPESIQLFLKKCKERNFELPKKIWECAVGQGHIAKELTSEGYDILGTDLVDRGYGKSNVDFLKITLDNMDDSFKPYLKCIFTNPPYALSKLFVEKSLELLDSDGICIMFLKTTFLETKGRLDLFKNRKLKYVWQYVNRQGCGKTAVLLKTEELLHTQCLFGIILIMDYLK